MTEDMKQVERAELLAERDALQQSLNTATRAEGELSREAEQQAKPVRPPELCGTGGEWFDSDVPPLLVDVEALNERRRLNAIELRAMARVYEFQAASIRSRLDEVAEVIGTESEVAF